jgi:hypothetical protein
MTTIAGYVPNVPSTWAGPTFTTGPTLNDGLTQTINDGKGVPAIQIRTGGSGSATNARLVRISDGAELACCGSTAAAVTLANSMITLGSVL